MSVAAGLDDGPHGGLAVHGVAVALQHPVGVVGVEQGHDAAEAVGYVHVLKEGRLNVDTVGISTLTIDQPALIIYMQPTTHRLLPAENTTVELVCGSIDFGAGCENPLTKALPSPLIVPLSNQKFLLQTLELLFTEAFAEECGRQQALNRLCELLLIQLLRHLIDSGEVEIGPLAGLADPRLAQALNAIHNAPENNWSLESLAASAGMTRARFAVNFRDTVGMTPGDYLTQWRLSLAQSLLRKGKPVGLVAHAVGYSGPAALSRVFNSRLGASPTQWLKSTGAEYA